MDSVKMRIFKTLYKLARCQGTVSVLTFRLKGRSVVYVVGVATADPAAVLGIRRESTRQRAFHVQRKRGRPVEINIVTECLLQAKAGLGMFAQCRPNNMLICRFGEANAD